MDVHNEQHTHETAAPTPPPQQAQVPESWRRIVKAMWIALGAGVLGVVLFFFYLSFSIPSFEELENPKSDVATVVYFANGEELGRYYIENRVPVRYEELSPWVVQALIATEDARFYKHPGIDPRSLARVAVKTVLLGQESSGGGSTITQQLAKLLYPRPDYRGMNKLQRTWALVKRKFQEWLTAVKLERSYTKEEIMTMYLNKFDFLYDSHGIRAAAETYFGKEQDSLKVEEAATLVGMLKNPALFNPVRRPDTVLHRRNVVLKLMVEHGFLTQEQYDSLKTIPLDMSRFKRKTHSEGPAPYALMEIRKDVQAILRSDEAKRKSDGTPYDIYRDGLKVYTTLDPVIQAHAEAAMRAHMKEVQERFWREWGRQDPWTWRDKETTDAEMAARRRKLTWMIRGSDRYGSMRARIFEPVADKLTAEIEGLRLRDVDMDRLIEADKNRKSLARLVSRELISSRMARQYEQALDHELWPQVKKAWLQLQDEVDKAFKTPVPMRVFAYNDAMEKDTVMSPLDSLKYHHSFLQIGSLAVDPHTGHVKAWIGGINYKYFQFDHTRTQRQVGSTFKPFVYAAAIAMQGISPCYQIPDIPRSILPGEGNFGLTEEWTPQNAKGEYTGQMYTLFDGLKKSINTFSVYLMKQLGSTEPVRELVRNMGIDVDAKNPNGSLRVPKVPSICLGAADLSVYEMTGAYTTFANNGVYNKPIYLLRIEDRNGRVLYESLPYERQALDERANYVMVEMLKYASGPMGLKSEVGGKTGTTNDYVDGWFMGITPDLVVGTWVGGEDRWIRFRTLYNGQGARMAKPFFRALIERLENDPEADYDPNARFQRPPGDLGIELDCARYAQAGEEFEDYPEEEDDGFFEDAFGNDAPARTDSLPPGGGR
ncbi:MAG: penicillin-binding protein [Bacteroidetes bacterium]|nr:MAG: penicillin-binding protein [Bacteroidota bacterium]